MSSKGTPLYMAP